MKKQFLSLILAVCLVLSLLPSAALATNDNIEGTALPSVVDVNSGVAWSATAKDGSTITQDTYRGKVQILVFFDISGSCGNSNTTLESLAKSELVNNEKVQIIAIGVPTGKKNISMGSADLLNTYLSTYVTTTSGKIVYAWMSGNDAAFSYSGAAGQSSKRLTFAVNVVLGTDGHIRSVWGGNYTADYYASVLELMGVEGVTGHTGDYQLYTTKITGTADYAAAQEELAILNNYRINAKENGLTQVALDGLTLDSVLTEAAMQRAAEIAVYYSHTRPQNASCFTVASSAERENIAIGYTSVSEVMDAWEHSSGHNANILAAENKSVGIGCFTSPSGVKCWVQLFSSSAGTATTRSSAETKSYDISAAKKVLELSLSSTSVTVATGQSVTLTLNNKNKEFRTVEQIHATSASSADSAVAAVSINADGTVTVTGTGDGSTTLKIGLATSSGDPYTVTVTKYAPGTVPVTGVTLDKTSLTLVAGNSGTLTAAVKPSGATNDTVTWSSSNPAVATVSGGVVTAVAEGTATITAKTADGGYTASCVVTVQDSILGDLNNDGKVNVQDLNIVWNAANYNKSAAKAENSLTDLNGDGSVNVQDLNLIWNAANYNKGTGN